jgi:hypothetical protein
MEPHEKATTSSKRQIMLNNFLGGISWSLGTTIGFTIILMILGYILSQVDVVPLLGEFLSDVMKSSLQQTQPKLFDGSI